MKNLINLKLIPNFIIINNLLLVFLRVCRFITDFLGISLFVIIIISILNDQAVELDLKFGKFELSFLNDLPISQIIMITFIIFFIKFLISLLLTFSDLKIRFKIFIFTQKLALIKFYFNELKDLILKDNSKIYRSLTTEVKFTSFYITSIFSALTNSLILITSFVVIFFLIGSYAFLILLFFIFTLGLYLLFFSKKMSNYGNDRLKFNLQFYKFFHNTLEFLKEIKFFKKSNNIIGHLSHIKKKEWQVSYFSNFIELSTPIFIEIIVISITLLIIYFNDVYFLRGNSEIIFLIVLMIRTVPYLKELQSNLNLMNLYKPSFDSFSHNYIKKKNTYQKQNKISLNSIRLKTKVNDRLINLQINKNEKVFIYNKDYNILYKLMLNLTAINSGNKSYLYLNNKLFKKNDLANSIGKIGYSDENTMIFELTLIQNITLSLNDLDSKRLKKVNMICELLNIKKLNKNKVLIDKSITKNIKIKIGIARALYHVNELIIFNNSFKDSILENKTKEKILDYLKNKFVIVLSDEKNKFIKFNEKLIN